MAGETEYERTGKCVTEDGKRRTYHSLWFIGTARREPEFAEMLFRRRRYRVEAGLGSLWAW